MPQVFFGLTPCVNLAHRAHSKKTLVMRLASHALREDGAMNLLQRIKMPAISAVKVLQLLQKELEI